MLKVTLQGAWARKRRMFGTFLAIFLGVSFLTGTLVLGDTVNANFDTLFSSVTRGTDAVVRTSAKVTDGREDVRGPLDASLVQQARAVQGVAAAEPEVSGYGALLGRDGKAIGGNGPPRLAGNWVSNSELNPYRIVQGRPPAAPDEVVVNRGAAEKGNLKLGDTTTVQTPDPVTVRIVGIAEFGSEAGFGGVTFTAFTLPAAQQHLMARPGQVSDVLVRGEPGVSQQDIVARLQRALPTGTEAITGAQLTKENTNAIDASFLNSLRTFLVIFAAIALLVATFSIYNTFSIVAAQRTREAALLRAVGSTRGQVFRSGLLESAVVGAVASLAGLVGGIGVAGLLKGMFDSFGFALPAGGLTFKLTSAVVPLAVGMAVTLVAGLAPAVRASRVRPMAALRESAAEAPRVAKSRVFAGLGIAGAGVALVLASALGGSSAALGWAGLGALLTIVGVVVFGPVVAGPVGAAIGLPLARLRGMTGSLARRNATRNPRRTSATAAALLVGVAVVTLFTTFGASIKASLNETVRQSFGGDLVIGGGRFGGPSLSPRIATDVARLPEVGTAVGIGRGVARVGASDRSLSVTDPAALSRLVKLDVSSGSVADLAPRQLAVAKTVADDRGWRVGTAVPVTFADGATEQFTVGALYGTTDVVGQVLMSRPAWAPHATQDVDATVLVGLRSGTSLAAGRTAVERAVAPYGDSTVRDRDEFIASVASGVNMVLGLIYVLLFLAILIAAMGIANTLSLSVYERTRELGVLRAVGQTRGQLRSMVRWESVIVSTFGAVGGLGVGAFLGWALVTVASHANAADGPARNLGVFALPVAQLGVVLAAGALVGVLAALRPARRAARLNVLAAIAAQ
ncbi:MAG TPA: FtsX-like permease family protein [Acidimicrobiales bacterium]|nr:FtsX-like permease family protein [Acidimicrobiales bacterium]